jgi:hypothetical protein
MADASPMPVPAEMLDGFLALSEALTGFGTFHLRGTGQAEGYLATTTAIVGAATMRALLTAAAEARASATGDAAKHEAELRRLVMSDDRLGPIARNIIRMWYVGTWYELPKAWREAYGQSPRDQDHVVSPISYTEGLLWPAVGGNPPGAKPAGYGMWAMPPRISPG